MNSKFLRWCRNYLSIGSVLVIGAIVYMIFFQENSMAQIYTLEQQRDSLEHEINMNRDTMLYYQRLNQGMDNHDPEIVERVARENFNMTKPDEDVYVYR